MSKNVPHTPLDFAAASAAVGTAVLRLRGAALHEELGRIMRAMLHCPVGGFALGAVPVDGAQLCEPVRCEGVDYGHYRAAGRSDWSVEDWRNLSSLAALTASLMQSQAMAQHSTRAFAQVEAKLAHQSQILDQIQESVLTIDMQGVITSWNKGAERMFGYTALEAIGAPASMLHPDAGMPFPEHTMQFGGGLMEVRRRKKSGEVFWASLSLSNLSDPDDNPVGMIAYMSDITERKRAEERLHHLAYYDELTGLPNRSLFSRLVDQALTVVQRNEGTGCVLFIDLNRFKLVNGTLGRKVGDDLLRQVARRFRDCLRDEDVVAHLSGDEFAVGLFDIRQHFEATRVAQKLQGALEAPFRIAGHEISVGASVGISVYPTDGNDAETLLRMADIAMERAKKGNENPDRSVAFYSYDMNQGMQERMQIESGLRHALGHGELILYYQPKFEIGTGRIVGAEALVRWVHPERGMVPPSEFIPLAESTGLIVQLGQWVLEQACAQASAWQRAGLPRLRLAVNVSAREFTDALPVRVAETLLRYQLDPAWLELEITESTLMDDIDRVIGIMDRITALGVALSLDDFGTGYSSLSYLKRFPIKTLKIDRSFTTGIPSDPSDCAIASTIISIGRQLRHRVIAEGVEHPEQLEFLRNSGCDEVQGYLYARPLPASEFETGLRETWAVGA